MRNLVVIGLLTTSMLCGSQALASNKTASHLLLGNYTAECRTGSAIVETRNIPVDQGKNQEVVHLSASSSALAHASIEDLHEEAIILTTPINFHLVKGTGKYLIVHLAFIPVGSNNRKILGFAVPGTKLKDPGRYQTLEQNGNIFTVPLRSSGVTAGSRLLEFSFIQTGEQDSCDKKTSDIDELQVNGRFLGIDADFPSQSCQEGCD